MSSRGFIVLLLYARAARAVQVAVAADGAATAGGDWRAIVESHRRSSIDGIRA